VLLRDFAEAADDAGRKAHEQPEAVPSAERASAVGFRDARFAEQEALPEINVQIQHFQQHRLGLDALDDKVDGIGIERALEQLWIVAEQAAARRLRGTAGLQLQEAEVTARQRRGI